MRQDLDKVMELRSVEAGRAAGQAVPHNKANQPISNNGYEQQENLALQQSCKHKLGCCFASAPAQISCVANLNTALNREENWHFWCQFS